MVVDQLRHILVAGGDDGAHVTSGRVLRKGADDIVGFNALDHQQGQAEGTDDVVQGFDLLGEIIRHWRSIGLVGLEQLVAESLPAIIEDDRDALRAIFAEQLAKHVDHAVNRPGGLAPGVGQRRQGVVGTKEIGGAVHQNQRCGVGVGGGHQGRSRSPAIRSSTDSRERTRWARSPSTMISAGRGRALYCDAMAKP